MAATGLENVSDTARWVALYRALETERRDARFRDPYARRLAGARGEAIAKSLPGFRSGLWPMVVRTSVFDELVLRAVEQEGVDTIVNLAAGLDARPWRLPLPQAVRWVDVDLPGMLRYKTDALAGEKPSCAYEAEAADLTRAAERRALFARLGAGCRRALVLSEGLLIYLADDDVAALAADLHAVPTFREWLIDLVSPRLLAMLNKRWGSSLDAARAPLRFAPASGTRFFERHGWREREFRSTFEEGLRIGRAPRGAWLWKLLGRFASPEKREELRRLGGMVLLERID
ncbi:MAG TPA: class I SAM-dependent methyltransferase [Thermoanaerobaculia bacterium]|nr:class I SAM-dependent methyltransferase [Thermoanaerobaculia bacterium]